MKKIITLFVCLVLAVGMLGGCAFAEEVQQGPQDGDWTLPEEIGMTDEVTALFNSAMEGLVGVSYEALGFLGEKDGVYCILCRATGVYPGATPYYALVYVTEAGVQNIWEIWMDAHSRP